MSTIVIILTISIVVQLVSAILSIRLIFSVGNRVIGIATLTAVFLMAFRRCIALYRVFTVGSVKADITAEFTGLIVSTLFLIVIIYMTKLIKNLKILGGLLPICASCKQIRNDSGYWQKIESYITDHSEAEFSHSICPECMEKLYPEEAAKIRMSKN